MTTAPLPPKLEPSAIAHPKARQRPPPSVAEPRPAAAAEQATSFPWRAPAFWAAFVGYWLFFATLFSISRMVQGSTRGFVMSVRQSVAITFSDGFFTALMCLLAFVLAWHLPIQRSRMRTARNLGLALLGGCTVSAVVQCVQTSIAHAILGIPMPNYAMLLMMAMPGNAQIFTCFMGAGYAIRFFTQDSASSAAAARLASESTRLEGELTRAELQVARSQLQVLKMQLDPHFLFNTFNAVTTLMHRDPVAADDMLTRLSELLRITLSRSGEDEVTLREELQFLRLYLEIQQSRFGDRLTLEWRIDPSTEGARVPPMIL
ncbi:MAG: histidine kinase, partial [Gemmatimonadetes bacterium]|nr:histidine kinase [Gemmatimonadota bacterium]